VERYVAKFRISLTQKLWSDELTTDIGG